MYCSQTGNWIGSNLLLELEKAVLLARAELNDVMGIGHYQVFDIVDPLKDRVLTTTELVLSEKAMHLVELANPAIQRDHGEMGRPCFEPKPLGEDYSLH